MKSACVFVVATILSTVVGAPPARASCNDRPGTPDLVQAEATALGEITFKWRNTTGRSFPTTRHTSYFDISVRDGAGREVGQDMTGMGPFTVTYRSWSLHTFRGLAPGATLCSRIRARTDKGTEGCVSEIFSAPACATTPTPEIDAVCKAYGAKAYSQVMNFDRMERSGACRDRAEDPRWSSDTSQHYAWCVRVRQEGKDPVFEERARDGILKTCKPKIATGDPSKQPPPPPSAPMPAGAQCNVGVLMTLDGCTNADDGTETTNWDYKGLSPACGLGADLEQAKDNAIDAYSLIRIIVKDEPDAGECGYEYQHIPACSCDPRLATSARSYQPKAPPPPARPVTPAGCHETGANCGLLSIQCQAPLPIADEVVVRDLRSSLGMTVMRTVPEIGLVDAKYFREGEALVQVCTRNRGGTSCGNEVAVTLGPTACPSGGHNPPRCPAGAILCGNRCLPPGECNKWK